MSAMSYPVPIRHWLLPARHCLPRPRVVSRCPTLILSPTLPIFCRLRDSNPPSLGPSGLLGAAPCQAGAGRREAHTAHAAGRGGTKLEGEPRAPSSTAPSRTKQRAIFLKKNHEQRSRNQRAIFFKKNFPAPSLSEACVLAFPLCLTAVSTVHPLHPKGR
jgi:hypothetical protein